MYNNHPRKQSHITGKYLTSHQKPRSTMYYPTPPPIVPTIRSYGKAVLQDVTKNLLSKNLYFIIYNNEKKGTHVKDVVYLERLECRPSTPSRRSLLLKLPELFNSSQRTWIGSIEQAVHPNYTEKINSFRRLESAKWNVV